jgi:hypothetical protein
MTTKKVLRACAALALSGALVAGYATAAAASGGSNPGSNLKPGDGASLADWQKAETARIDLRLATLAGLKLAINAAADLSSAHKSALQDLVSSDVSGLSGLRSKVAAETTIAAVKADGRSMVVDYRIYMLVVPQVRFTIGSDIQAAAVARLQSIHDKLAGIASQLKAQGKDVSKIDDQLTDMASKLAACTSAIAGKADGLLATHPSADPNAMHAAVSPVRTAMRSGRDDLKGAITDAKSVRSELKALAGNS